MLGNLGELAKLMSKAKDIQATMKAMKEDMPKMEFSATGANAGVKVTVSGDFMVKEVEIPAGADPAQLAEEIRMAANSAIAAAKSTIQERMKAATGDLGIDLPML